MRGNSRRSHHLGSLTMLPRLAFRNQAKSGAEVLRQFAQNSRGRACPAGSADSQNLTNSPRFVTIEAAMRGKIEIFVVESEREGLSAIQQAARILASGGLVAFPTETVYGIGANAHDSAAIRRLRAVKQRPPDKPFSVHIAAKEELAKHVGQVPIAGRKLVDAFWPGPLTILFGRMADAVGVRFPAHEIAIAFIRACGVPVVAPSANLSGQKPAAAAEEVARTFGEKIDALLDAGPAPLAQSSTVVRVWRSGWEMVRTGIISESAIERALKTNVLFVCTGNSCRSPIAETLCRRVLAEHLRVDEDALPALGYDVASAGTATVGGGRPSEDAVAAAGDAGLVISGHRTQPMTVELLTNADKVYGMTRGHVQAGREMCPSAESHIELLDPDGADIEDPVGLSPDGFTRVVSRIRRCLERRVKEL